MGSQYNTQYATFQDISILNYVLSLSRTVSANFKEHEPINIQYQGESTPGTAYAQRKLKSFCYLLLGQKDQGSQDFLVHRLDPTEEEY